MTDTVSNRSEIVFITDAQDCNPNGNPLAENNPRIDPVTGQAAITDVRFKRYLRDQLHADGHPIFIKRSLDTSDAPTRAKLALDTLGDITTPTDIEAIEDVTATFLQNAVDVRYFGAMLNFHKQTDDALNEAIREHFPTHFTGPVQFSPARSLNPVATTDALSSLSSVIASQEDKEQGVFGIDDTRIKYGIFPFHGLIDENAAQNTNLSTTDVKRLDSLCWRAIKNQTLTRSKIGQQPRLYVRVEYATPGYHEGDLHTAFTIDAASSQPDAKLQSVRDICLDITPFISQLEHANERNHIEMVHIAGNDQLRLSINGEQIPASTLTAELTDRDIPVRKIAVFEESADTLPAN